MSMSKSILLAVVAAFVSVGLFAVVTQLPKKAAADDAKPPEMKIAIVNVEDVFNKLKERAAREDDLNKRKEALRAEIQKMDDQVQGLLKEHDAMSVDDPKRNAKQEQIVQLQADAEGKYKRGVAMLAKRELSDRQELYGMIRDAIDKYAADNKLTLVLKADNKRVSDNPDSQSMEISQRNVLYSDASLNITAEIIKALNK
jgi:Skp family chaperone for outer membrane proteins